MNIDIADSFFKDFGMWDWRYIQKTMCEYLRKVILESSPEVIVTINKKGSAIFEDVRNYDPSICDGVDVCNMEVKRSKAGLSIGFYDQDLIKSRRVLLFDDYVNTGETLIAATNTLNNGAASVKVGTVFASDLACSKMKDLVRWREIGIAWIPYIFVEWSTQHVAKLGLERFSKDSLVLKAHFNPPKDCSFLMEILRRSGISYRTYMNASRPGISSMIGLPLKNPLSQLKIYCNNKTGNFDFWVHEDVSVDDGETHTCNKAKYFCLKENNSAYCGACPKCTQLHTFGTSVKDILKDVGDLSRSFDVRFVVEGLKCASLEHSLGQQQWQNILKILSL